MGLRLSEEREIYIQVKASLRFAWFEFDCKRVKKFIRWCHQNYQVLNSVLVREVETWEEIGRYVAEAVQSKQKDVDLSYPGVFLTILRAVQIHHVNHSLVDALIPPSSSTNPSSTSYPIPHPPREP